MNDVGVHGYPQNPGTWSENGAVKVDWWDLHNRLVAGAGQLVSETSVDTPMRTDYGLRFVSNADDKKPPNRRP